MVHALLFSVFSQFKTERIKCESHLVESNRYQFFPQRKTDSSQICHWFLAHWLWHKTSPYLYRIRHNYFGRNLKKNILLILLLYVEWKFKIGTLFYSLNTIDLFRWLSTRRFKSNAVKQIFSLNSFTVAIRRNDTSSLSRKRN